MTVIQIPPVTETHFTNLIIICFIIAIVMASVEFFLKLFFAEKSETSEPEEETVEKTSIGYNPQTDEFYPKIVKFKKSEAEPKFTNPYINTEHNIDYENFNEK